jgi:hypothetical protein
MPVMIIRIWHFGHNGRCGTVSDSDASFFMMHFPRAQKVRDNEQLKDSFHGRRIPYPVFMRASERPEMLWTPPAA